MFQEERREPRYRVTDPAMVQSSLNYEDRRRAAVILDISQSGLRLRVDESLPIGARVRLSISASDAHIDAELNAKVCWSETDRDGWLVGCSFHPRLAWTSLNALAECGAIERRRDDRRLLSFAAEVKTSLTTDFHDIQIVNVSVGGFGAATHGFQATPDDRLLLRFANPGGAEQLIQARVAWVKEMSEGQQMLGCSFLTKSDFGKLRAVAEADRVGNPLLQTTPRTMSGTRWPVVATCLMMLIVVLQQILIAHQLLR